MSKRSSAGERVVKIGHIKGAIINLPEDVLRASKILENKGVKYQFVDTASSNEAYEAVVRGDIDVLSLVSLLPVLANVHKQPDVLKIFGTTDLAIEQRYDTILVKSGSPIQTLTDISGKTLKYGLFPGTTHTTFTKLYLKSKGVDISNIQFIQLPPQNHLQSLESGAIDVLGTYDPMTSLGLATGNYRELGYSVYANIYDHTPLGAGIINTKFMNTYPDLAKKVVLAHQEAYDLMISDSVNTYKVIADAYKIEKSIAEKVRIPAYATQIHFDKANLQKLVDYLYELKEIPQKVDTSKLIVEY